MITFENRTSAMSRPSVDALFTDALRTRPVKDGEAEGGHMWPPVP